MNYQKKWKKPVLPYYGVTALWLLFMVLQQSGQIIMKMALSIGLFLLLQLVGLHSKSEAQIHEKTDDPKADDKSPSEQVLRKCAVAVQDLDGILHQIKNIEVREKISKLVELSKKILNEVNERPEKIPKISTFVNYYIPTTFNILNAYRRAEAAGIEGKNINKMKQQIESILDSSILVVFNKQLDNLFGTDAIDISLELSVLEEMMLREGISGEKLEAQTTKNADGSDIRLTL